MTFPGAASKYHARAVVDAEGRRFASRREYARYCDLELMQAAGRISELQRQVRYPLMVNGFKVCDYIADATYEEDGFLVIEDTKGVRTPAYVLKKKLMRAIHGVEIREV